MACSGLYFSIQGVVSIDIIHALDLLLLHLTDYPVFICLSASGFSWSDIMPSHVAGNCMTAFHLWL